MILKKAAHSSHDFISHEAIYLTTGAPMPADIEQVVQWLFNAEFTEAYSSAFGLI